MRPYLRYNIVIMCVNDYKAVYKLKSKEKATGKDAEKYLTK